MNQKEGIYSDYPYLEKSNSKKKLLIFGGIALLIIIIVVLLILFRNGIITNENTLKEEQIERISDNPNNYNYCLAIATKDQSYCEKTDNKEKCIVDIGIIDNFKTLVKLDDCSSTTGIYNQMICRVMVSGDKKYCEALK